jgi:hypothetical protein
MAMELWQVSVHHARRKHGLLAILALLMRKPSTSNAHGAAYNGLLSQDGTDRAESSNRACVFLCPFEGDIVLVPNSSREMCNTPFTHSCPAGVATPGAV